MMVAKPGQQGASLKNIWPGHVFLTFLLACDLKVWRVNDLHHFFFRDSGEAAATKEALGWSRDGVLSLGKRFVRRGAAAPPAVS